MKHVARIGLISDTHGRLPNAVHTLFAGVDRILHAGDIGPLSILADLETIAPVTAVWGNTDGFDVRARTAEIERLEVEGCSIVLLHGHQVGSPNPAALAAAYADGEVVVFGHSHKPLIERVRDRLFVNPGSAGAPRFGIGASIAVLAITDSYAEASLIPI